MYAGFFLANWIFTLLHCCSYSLDSGSDLACLFHSSLYCCLISLHLTDLSLHLSLAASCTLWQSVYFFLALSAKSFFDCKYLSTITCASEGTFGESTVAQFLLDNSPLFDMHGVPSWLSSSLLLSLLSLLLLLLLLLLLCTSVLFGMFDFFNACFAYLSLICRLMGFFIKILRYAPILAIIGWYADQMWKKMYWIFFIHFRQNDFRPSTTPLWRPNSPPN